MRKMHILTSLVAVLLLSASTAFAEVKVTMHDGRVSVVAKDATLRQILTEWARVGQTKIVNVERIPGGPMTIELTNMPEQQALDLLLRSVSGFMTAARHVPVANLSQYDRIVVMPTSAAPRQAMAPQPSTPTFAQPQFTPPPVDDDVEDERPAPNVPMPNVAYPNGGVVGGVPACDFAHLSTHLIATRRVIARTGSRTTSRPPSGTCRSIAVTVIRKPSGLQNASVTTCSLSSRACTARASIAGRP